jgi:hypothetical protein
MNGFGIGLPAACLVGMGLLACSAAGNADKPGSGEDPSLDLGAQAAGDAQGSGSAASGNGAAPTNDAAANDPQAPGGSDAPTGDDTPPADVTNPQCLCDLEVPGIDVNRNDGRIVVTVTLPHQRKIAVALGRGTVKTLKDGIDLQGDVTVDFGAGAEVPLKNADLHLALPSSGIPSLSGSADVAGSLLQGLGSDYADDVLPMSVDLAVDTAGVLPQNDAPAALELGISLPSITLDTSPLPAAPDVMNIVGSKVDVLTDGAHRVVEVSGAIANGAATWTSMVPLKATSALVATAKLVDDELESVELDGDTRLLGDALSAGLVPLQAIELPSTTLLLDHAGATLGATANASIHPSWSLAGKAEITAKFAPSDWSIKVCGTVMTNLLGGGLDRSECLDFGKGGVTPCRLPIP